MGQLRKKQTKRAIYTLPVLAVLTLGTNACDDQDPGTKDAKQEAAQEGEKDAPPAEFRKLKNHRDVDVLFVIDNSGSMGEEQQALSRNFASFVEILDAPGLRANYRLGVTTTDTGSKQVNGCKTPENGALQLQSCKDRPEAFIDASGVTNRYNTACNSVCKLGSEQLQILPSRIDESKELAPRAWLERIHGQSNLKNSDVSIAEAFGCFGPQGIDGCGFESQLESMYQALKQSEEPTSQDHPNFGFLRDDAVLAVVHVSDELDCSINPNHPLNLKDPEAFEKGLLGQDSRAFWSKGQEIPSSANCFNAGVSCKGVDGDNYESCVAENKNLSGNTIGPNEDANQAVLAPIARYVQGIQAIANKKSSDGKGEVIVSLIGGVGQDGAMKYPRADLDSAEDQALRKEFGLGVGCSTESGFLEEKGPQSDEAIPAGKVASLAVPPVRIAAFASAFAQEGEQFAYSICQDDLTGPLKRIASSIAAKIEPSCYDGCVRDARPEMPEMVPECTLAMMDDTKSTMDVVKECLREDPEDPSSPYLVNKVLGSYQIPEGEELCFVARTDFDGRQTPDANDDLAAKCREQGRNVEFFIEYKKGYRTPDHKSLKVSCTLSKNPAIDCPQD